MDGSRANVPRAEPTLEAHPLGRRRQKALLSRLAGQHRMRGPGWRLRVSSRAALGSNEAGGPAALPSSPPLSWDCGASMLGACKPAPTLLGSCVSTWTLDLADRGASVGDSFPLLLSWMTLMGRERRMGPPGAARPSTRRHPQHHSVHSPAGGFEGEALCHLSFVGLQTHWAHGIRAPTHTRELAACAWPMVTASPGHRGDPRLHSEDEQAFSSMLDRVVQAASPACVHRTGARAPSAGCSLALPVDRGQLRGLAAVS